MDELTKYFKKTNTQHFSQYKKENNEKYDKSNENIYCIKHFNYSQI